MRSSEGEPSITSHQISHDLLSFASDNPVHGKITWFEQYAGSIAAFPGVIWIRIGDPGSLMHHDSDRSWITDPSPVYPKGTHPK